MPNKLDLGHICAMTTMDLDISLRILLQDIGLANYEAKLREHGYDSAQVLLNM